MISLAKSEYVVKKFEVFLTVAVKIIVIQECDAVQSVRYSPVFWRIKSRAMESDLFFSTPIASSLAPFLAHPALYQWPFFFQKASAIKIY
jgi:hypothetical protein